MVKNFLTQVAGTIVGKTHGISRNSNVYAVKVLDSDGTGSASDVLEGIEWVISAHKKRAKGRRSIANVLYKFNTSFH
jgi:cerevisin